MPTQLIEYWKIFMKEWIPKHRDPTDESRYFKPTFFDFMQWLSEKQ